MALSITLLHAPIISLCFLSFRFHAFALGFEICSELMSSLAAVTEGEYRVITENDRLQTKVIINPVVPILTSPPLGYGSSSDYPLTFSSKSIHHFLSSQWLLSNEGRARPYSWEEASGQSSSHQDPFTEWYNRTSYTISHA